jgi:hypothetical protein
MIVTSYTPNLKSPFSTSELETVSISSALDHHNSHSHNLNNEMMMIEGQEVDNVMLPLMDLKTQSATGTGIVFDQNTFFSYVYCFIKNFVG